MKDKKKILLGEKDIIAKSNEDVFINLELNSTFSELKNDKFTNEFDVANQFKKERNTSRDFRIYGTIDSTITDCDNIHIYSFAHSYSGTGSNSGVTHFSGFVKTITSTGLVYDGLNVYGKKRGKFLLELTGYTGDFVYMTIPSNNLTYKNQYYSQQLIFHDSDGKFMDYGTQTIEVDSNGNAIEINNDFYFMYNKHWIKKELEIIEEKPAIISFSATPLTDTVLESNTPNSLFSIVLDKPSPFGLEEVDLIMQSGTLTNPTEIVIKSGSTNIAIPYSNISFSIGEQYKNFSFNSPEDFFQETVENINLELVNFRNVTTGSTLTHEIFVIDNTPKNSVKLNLQEIYQNRNFFYGMIETIGFLKYQIPMPSVLRNGLFFESTPMEFYPIDSFDIEIKNIGINTITPINPSFGIFNEQIFSAGTSITINGISQQYLNSSKHSIEFAFGNRRYSSTQGTNIPSNQSGFTINGIPIVNYHSNYKFDYDTILSCLKNTTLPPFNNSLSGWFNIGLDVPYDIIENLSALTITLIAKNPGTRLDVIPYGFSGDIFDNSSVIAANTMSARTKNYFVYSSQTPFEIILRANDNNNTTTSYEFTFSKKGYKSINFTSTGLNASVNPTTYYLVSSYDNILRNWDDNTNSPVYVHDGITSNIPGNVRANGNQSTYNVYGLYKYGNVFVNGILFLSDVYTSVVGSQANVNITNPYSEQWSPTINSKCVFLPSPISVEPSTTEFYSPQSSSQRAYVGMANVISNLHRSFDFRTGYTGNYNTYYQITDFQSGGKWIWDNYVGNPNGKLYSSGGTFNNHVSGLKLDLKTYLQDGFSTYGLTDFGVTGNLIPYVSDEFAAMLNTNKEKFQNFWNTPSYFFEISSNTPGNPFEFTNFKTRNPYNGAIIQSESMVYQEIIPNEIQGITINKANNHMGGYKPNWP